jgi:hypothetical protein
MLGSGIGLFMRAADAPEDLPYLAQNQVTSTSFRPAVTAAGETVTVAVQVAARECGNRRGVR